MESTRTISEQINTVYPSTITHQRAVGAMTEAFISFFWNETMGETLYIDPYLAKLEAHSHDTAKGMKNPRLLWAKPAPLSRAERLLTHDHLIQWAGLSRAFLGVEHESGRVIYMHHTAYGPGDSYPERAMGGDAYYIGNKMKKRMNGISDKEKEELERPLSKSAFARARLLPIFDKGHAISDPERSYREPEFFEEVIGFWDTLGGTELDPRLVYLVIHAANEGCFDSHFLREEFVKANTRFLRENYPYLREEQVNNIINFIWIHHDKIEAMLDDEVFNALNLPDVDENEIGRLFDDDEEIIAEMKSSGNGTKIKDDALDEKMNKIIGKRFALVRYLIKQRQELQLQYDTDDPDKRNEVVYGIINFLRDHFSYSDKNIEKIKVYLWNNYDDIFSSLDDDSIPDLNLTAIDNENIEEMFTDNDKGGDFKKSMNSIRHSAETNEELALQEGLDNYIMRKQIVHSIIQFLEKEYNYSQQCIEKLRDFIWVNYDAIVRLLDDDGYVNQNMPELSDEEIERLFTKEVVFSETDRELEKIKKTERRKRQRIATAISLIREIEASDNSGEAHHRKQRITSKIPLVLEESEDSTHQEEIEDDFDIRKCFAVTIVRQNEKAEKLENESSKKKQYTKMPFNNIEYAQFQLPEIYELDDISEFLKEKFESLNDEQRESDQLRPLPDVISKLIIAEENDLFMSLECVHGLFRTEYVKLLVPKYLEAEYNRMLKANDPDTFFQSVKDDAGKSLYHYATNLLAEFKEWAAAKGKQALTMEDIIANPVDNLPPAPIETPPPLSGADGVAA
jgi:hypothetical protein